MTQSPITRSEVAAFSAKLDEWAKTLSPKERALLHVLLRTAEAAVPEKGELPDSELEAVAGGLGGPPSPQGQTANLLDRLLGSANFGSPFIDNSEHILLAPANPNSPRKG